MGQPPRVLNYSLLNEVEKHLIFRIPCFSKEKKSNRGRTFPKPITAAIPAVILQLLTRCCPTGCTMGHVGQYLHLPLLGLTVAGRWSCSFATLRIKNLFFCLCDFSSTGCELKEPLKHSPSSSNWKTRPAYCRKKLHCVTQVFPKCSRTPTNSIKIPSNGLCTDEPRPC